MSAFTSAFGWVFGAVAGFLGGIFAFVLACIVMGLAVILLCVTAAWLIEWNDTRHARAARAILRKPVTPIEKKP